MANEIIIAKENIEFILSHFRHQSELFPRTIMTAKTGGQKIIEFDSDDGKCKDKILQSFRASKYEDCRINAYPFETEHHMNLEVKNKTAPSFIFIDLDIPDFQTKDKLDRALNKTLRKLSIKLHGANPTVLWTGNGYHIYQPIEGFVLESEQVFYDFSSVCG